MRAHSDAPRAACDARVIPKTTEEVSISDVRHL